MEANTEMLQAADFSVAENAESTPIPVQRNISMTVSVLPTVSYGLWQNGTYTVQSVTIGNNEDEALENVQLQIGTQPAFALSFSHRISCIPAHKTVTLSHPELLLDARFLANVEQQQKAVVQFSLVERDTCIASAQAEVTLLAFHQWQGLGLYPELLAGYVTPDSAALIPLMARAGQLMKKWTDDEVLDGYQSQDPARVLLQAKAIYTAIQEWSVAGVESVLDLNAPCQSIRLCEHISRQNQANPLEFALLYASCLENAGLRPLLIASAEQILAGFWLEERSFPESVQNESSLILQRLEGSEKELEIIAPFCAAVGQNVPFEQACAMAAQILPGLAVDSIVDVRRARISRVLPLPERVQTPDGWEIKEKSSAWIQNARDDGLSKKAQWERKLLDLGLRNTLINLRFTKTQLPIFTDSLNALEDALADGRDFSVLPKPANWKPEELTFESLLDGSVTETVRAEFENYHLRSVFTEGELNQSIKGLYRSAKAALEENGANTLYLALGMLRWYENKRSTKARYAPVILLPIEMVRRSASQGYVIRLRDDEPQMNITLLEKLKQDFQISVHGVDPLPTDEHGIDIPKVLELLREAVDGQPNWAVLETASIGIFSFSQFVMWNDIHNRTDDLLRSKVVSSLIEGKLRWEATPLESKTTVLENNVLLPMPADASQLFAIEEACKGKSFVLHGPPGTGKSQTITSLIANALAKGKRVLFVAEKMAALQVVQKRLEGIGISPFCLELHSNKSKKKDVLEQLRQATEVTKTKTAAEFAEKAEKIAAMRAHLDSYAKALHRPLKSGSTLYQRINEYEAYKDAPDMPGFESAYLKQIDHNALEQNQLVLEQLVAAGREVGHPHKHPLQSVCCTRYSENLRNSVEPTVEAYIQQLEYMSECVQTLQAVLGEKQPVDFAGLQTLSGVASKLACWYGMPAAWTKCADPKAYFDDIKKLAQHARQGKTLSQQLLEHYSADILEQDGQQLYDEYIQTASKWFLPRFFGQRRLVRQLKVYANEKLDKTVLKPHLTLLRDCQREQKSRDLLLAKYQKELGQFYKEDATDWEKVTRLATIAQKSAEALKNRYGSHDVLNRHCGTAALKTAALGLWKDFEKFTQAKQSFDSLLRIAQRRQQNWLAGQISLCHTILEHADELRQWIAYVAVAAQAKSLGLTNVVSFYAGGAEHDTVLNAYQKALLKGIISYTIDSNNRMNQFSGAVFSKRIEQYKRMDQEWTRLSQQEIYCRLASKVPDFTREASQSSELGILQRCIRSGGRGTSIRKLFDQIPNLLPRLVPCMLMSPISAAQYLDPKREPFDIVVFDEASQLPTCKAVGVLARGKEAIVVGDPKQMPPTSFFATDTTDEDNLDKEDLESILDDCLALNMPQSHLLWHYRSRHESLIAFSNSRFYENKLYTFPSVNDRESKVRLVPVEGVFDRGKTRRNHAEAVAVVEELKRRCHTPELSGQSVGVVTFNISQQNLIDDLLNAACTQDPELEKWAYGSEEPVFIKNLENVQGDERDVILFSIGYGPDETGKVYMNFGPLNRDGGWRRLNVAVSRARCEMVVYSTLRADQIDLNRTKAEGVAALRSFLEYAEGRTAALEETQTQPNTENDGIVNTICTVLQENGFETDRSVGRSEYRIDIGVVDPNQPDRYILGIMLDGASYGAARTTRDREIAQISVLKGLGWNIMRVWSLDWWANRQRELDKILKVLKDLQSGKLIPAKQQQTLINVSAPMPQQEEELTVEDAPATVGGMKPPVYQAAKLPYKVIPVESFTEPRHVQSIRKKLEQVIEVEAPVSAATLTRRVVQSFGIIRAGNRMQSHIQTILKSMKLKATVQAGVVFYWRAEQTPDDYSIFRVSGNDQAQRDVRDVPAQEIANAIYVVLYEQVSMAQDALLREVARKLGYSRVGSNVLSALELGIRYARHKDCITPGAGGAYILTDTGTAKAEQILESLSK